MIVNLENVMPRVMREHGGGDFTICESGDYSRVALVKDADEPYVVKTPRGGEYEGEAWKLWEEVEILRRLTSAGGSPLYLPRPREYSHSPLYAVFGEVPGSQYSSDIDLPLSETQKHEAGQRIGLFVAWAKEALPVKVFWEEIRSASADSLGYKWSYDDYFSKYVKGFALRGFPSLSAVAQSCWTRYESYYPDGADFQGDMVRGSYKQQNLTWDRGRLYGAFDWGDAKPGNVNQALSGAFRMGPVMLEAAIQELENHNIRVDPDHIRWWVAIRTVGQLCVSLRGVPTSNRRVAVVAERLARLYPDEDWGELEHLRSQDCNGI